MKVQKEMIKSGTTKDEITFKLGAHCRTFVANGAPTNAVALFRHTMGTQMTLTTSLYHAR